MTRPITRSTILDTDLYCLTAEKFSGGRSNIDVVRDMLAAGVSLVQYREKSKSMRDKYEECLALRQMTREAGAAFIVNDDVHLGVLTGADGVHIGQDDLPVAAVRQLVGEHVAIGVSTHSPEQAQKAKADGADYIGVGPIFKTFTKEDVCDPVGFAYLKWAAANAGLPFVAIGGIKAHNVADVVRRGARCVAMVTEIVAAKDIPHTIDTIRRHMADA